MDPTTPSTSTLDNEDPFVFDLMEDETLMNFFFNTETTPAHAEQLQEDFSQISMSSTYLEINENHVPSIPFQHVLNMEVMVSKRERYGATHVPPSHQRLHTCNIDLQFDIGPQTKKKEGNYYIYLKEATNKSKLVEVLKIQENKYHMWIRFGNSTEYYLLFCQTGKGTKDVHNVLKYNPISMQSGGSRSENLNSYSSCCIKPTSVQFYSKE